MAEKDTAEQTETLLDGFAQQRVGAAEHELVTVRKITNVLSGK